MKKSSRLSLNLFRALMRDATLLDKEPAMKFLLVREDTSPSQTDGERSKGEANLCAQMMEKYQTDVLGPTIHYNPAYACSSIASVVRKHFKTNKDVSPKVFSFSRCSHNAQIHYSHPDRRPSNRFWIYGIEEVK